MLVWTALSPYAIGTKRTQNGGVSFVAPISVNLVDSLYQHAFLIAF